MNKTRRVGAGIEVHGSSRTLLPLAPIPLLVFALALPTACSSPSSTSGRGAGGTTALGGAAGAGGVAVSTAGSGGGSITPSGTSGGAPSASVGSGGSDGVPSSSGGAPVGSGSGGASGGANSGGASGAATGSLRDAGSSDGATGSGGCTRALLVQLRDSYFTAIAAHDPSRLPTASSIKFTENGKTTSVGDGFWKTAGAAKFKRSALDTVACDSVTEAVVTEGSTDIVLGVRIGVVAGKVTELETIVVRQGDYFSNPSALAASASDDWETVLAADQRPTSDVLQEIVEKYFKQFPGGACNFASDCKRLENGFSPGGCTAGLSCSTSTSPGSSSMTPRLYLYDLDAGIAVGFVLFAGAYTDFHMFKVRGGQVHGVHATLAKASSTGW